MIKTARRASARQRPPPVLGLRGRDHGRGRAAWDVPPLAEQLRRADELTRSQPQPSMEEAPAWLRAAIERRASGR